MADEDFDEEDVWAVMKESPKVGRKPTMENASVSAAGHHRRLPSASRMVPRAFGSGIDGINGGRVLQQSAPVNIPDWSKIHSNGLQEEDGGGGIGTRRGEDHENDEGDDDRLPPHEWIAKKLARSGVASFSVCEGVGRKLKGRDLSKVRNSVLTRTGFLE
ncbi:hypothetical protein ACLOJK_029771 [Asimina triloba]